jgi:phosphoribosylaminoimidazolecarboxamide formyltransferase/IMP cyclohydrolase
VAEAGLNLQGATMASDAFFPFSDSIEIAAKAGISVIIQPGGSIKDEDVINKANELGVAMVFTKIRHFLH